MIRPVMNLRDTIVSSSRSKSKSTSYATRQLDSIRRREDMLIDGIKKLPRATPQLGLLGQGINLLREFPDPFVEASSYAFGNKGLFLFVNAFENTLTN